MSVLTRDAIEERLAMEGAKRLSMTPLLHRAQIGDASVDVRLGNEFLLLTRTQAAAFDYQERELGTQAGVATFRRTRRDFRQPLYLHPHQLVLGATFEFIRLPTDLMAYVIGRSSLGRTGLVIATATAVAPGFAGCVTLEIVNLGEVPLPLYPGMRIAQLVLHEVRGEAAYGGRFACSVGPEPPLLGKDTEMRVWAADHDPAAADSRKCESSGGERAA